MAGLSFGPALGAPAPAASANLAPKTHVLFMGADIAVERDKQFYRIEDVTEMALVIKPNGKTVSIPQSPTVNLGISDALKLAATNVSVGKLVTERVYTPGADPFRRLAQSVALAAGESAVADLANGELVRANGAVLAANNMAAVAGNPDDRAHAAAALSRATGLQAAAEAGLNSAYNAPRMDALDIGSRSVAAGLSESRELFDAIRVTFEVTPERDLSKPYYAVIAQVHEPDSKPGQVRKWAYVKSLNPLSGGVPKTVTIFQGGLPPGYILDSCEVHLYNRGEEIATNLSRKRVPLTDAEAQDYRIIEYVGANKGKTLAASVVTADLASEVLEPLTPAQLRETYYVRVAKDGRVTAVFRDAASKQPLSEPTVESALKTLRYKPALEAGKPVESIVTFTLGQHASP